MAKRRGRRKNRPAQFTSRHKVILIFSLILFLSVIGVVLGRRSGLPSPIAQQVPDSFSPSNPSKEYIYAGGKLVATEEPAPTCTYSISPTTNQNYPYAGGTGSVSVATQAGCAWTATSSASWVTFSSSSTGTGNGTVNYSVASNSNTSSRTATITIQTQTLTITQDAAPGTCSYTINSTSQNFGSNGGGGSVTVTTQAGCAWTATSNAGFITITSGSSGSGNGTVNFSVSQNTSTSSRSGTMTIAGQTFTVTQDPATDNSAFVSQSVQTSMTTSQTLAVSVTMQNTGTSTWTVGTYKLGSQNPQDNTTWGLNRVDLTSSVSPGSSAVFNFNITAPSTAGTYNFQWKMVNQGTGFFGASSTNVAITVTGGGGGGTNNAQFISQNISTTMTAGQSYSVFVTLKNTGTTTWTTATYKLGSQNPQDNTTWGFNRVSIGSNTSPGATRTIVFVVTAPSTAGSYNFQWRMLQEGVEWFGDSTTNVVVSVGSGGPTVPAAPSNLSAVATSSSQINLTWTDNSANEDGFKIERKIGLGAYIQIATVGAGITSYPDTGLAASTTYSYRVRAYNSAGDSAYSNVASATTTAGSSPPVAPSNLSATTASSSQINLTWLDNSTNEDGFKIERRLGLGAFAQIATVGPNATSFSDTGLTPLTGYGYRVRAYNSAGDSDYSNVASATTTGGPSPPTAPSNLSATATSSTQINLAWTDNSSTEDGFYVERKTGAGGTYSQIASPGANVTSYSDTGLSASTEYYYRVRAYNSAGTSSYSNEANATTSASGGSGGTCTQVSLFSGTGAYAYAEGAPTVAKWQYPNGGVVAKDPASGLYTLFVAATENQRIRMVYLEGANAGNSVFIAGSGTAGFVDGSATTARFNYPRGITAVTDANDVVTMLLVADTTNHCIRKLLPSGGSWTVSTFSGLGGTYGFTNGTASASRYKYPIGITAAPDGYIYVAENGNSAVRKLDSTGASTTFASPAPFGGLVGITVSKTTGLFYVSEIGTSKIKQITATGTVTDLAGLSAGYADGVGSSARFYYPYHLAWANTSNGEALYIADWNNNRIRKLEISTVQVSTFAGSGTAGFADGTCASAQFNQMRGVAVGPNGEVYVIDTQNNRIRKLQ